jgi:hypothetical protein
MRLVFCDTCTQLLVESKQWALELNLPSLSCPWTMTPSSADLRIIGFDLEHRPVIYSSMLMVVARKPHTRSPRFNRQPPIAMLTLPAAQHLHAHT